MFDYNCKIIKTDLQVTLPSSVHRDYCYLCKVDSSSFRKKVTDWSSKSGLEKEGYKERAKKHI